MYIIFVNVFKVYFQRNFSFAHFVVSCTKRKLVNIFITGIITYIQNNTNKKYSDKFLSLILHIFIFFMKSKHNVNIFL